MKEQDKICICWTEQATRCHGWQLSLKLLWDYMFRRATRLAVWRACSVNDVSASKWWWKMRANHRAQCQRPGRLTDMERYSAPDNDGEKPLLFGPLHQNSQHFMWYQLIVLFLEWASVSDLLRMLCCMLYSLHSPKYKGNCLLGKSFWVLTQLFLQSDRVRLKYPNEEIVFIRTLSLRFYLCVWHDPLCWGFSSGIYRNCLFLH